jgi:hypothetical protein
MGGRACDLCELKLSIYTQRLHEMQQIDTQGIWMKLTSPAKLGPSRAGSSTLYTCRSRTPHGAGPHSTCPLSSAACRRSWPTCSSCEHWLMFACITLCAALRSVARPRARVISKSTRVARPRATLPVDDEHARGTTARWGGQPRLAMPCKSNSTVNFRKLESGSVFS